MDKTKILFRKIKYQKHFVHYDQFGTENDNYKFEYDITISKCYSLEGTCWEIKMPNCVYHGKNLFELIVQSIEFATTKFPQYFRLEDELLRKDFWKKLGSR